MLSDITRLSLFNPSEYIISDTLTETLITGSHLYENRIKIKYWDRPLLGSGSQGTVYKV
jgi:hypothetical protein